MQAHRVRSCRLLLGLAVLLGPGPAFVAPTPVAAAPIEVTSLADPGTGGCTPAECTLREAIATAQLGDTITFAPTLFVSGPGTMTLRAGELVIAQDLTIDGPGRLRLSISGNNASRVLCIEAGSVTLSGITITGGINERGGGLYNNGTLTLRNSTVSGNTTSSVGIRKGGGLFNDVSGTLTILNSRIWGNHASRGGGGLANAGTLTLDSSTVVDNTANQKGGGLYNISGTLTILNSRVWRNHAHRGGGLSNKGTLMLEHSTVTDNTAFKGGGLYNFSNRLVSGQLGLRNSTVSGNMASRKGGGLYINSGTLMLEHSTVSGNMASGRGKGGGLFNRDGTLTLRNSTVSGNTADRGGASTTGRAR